MRFVGCLKKITERPWQLVLFLWSTSLFVRLIFYRLFLADNPCQLMFDSGHYHAMAKDLLLHGGFYDAAGLYHFYRLPGYPLFLAACYKLWGVVPNIAMLVQHIVAAFIPVQLFYFVRLVWPRPWWGALLVAMIGACHLGLLIFSGLVMTETLFVIVFMLFLIFLVRMWQGQQCSQALLAGLALGVCNLIRPLVFFPWCVALLCFALMSGEWRHRSKLVGTYLVGFMAVVACWVVRNWLLTGLWFLHTLSGPHMLNHGAIRVYAMAHKVTIEQARTEVVRLLPQEQNAFSKQQHAVQKSRAEEQLSRTILVRYWPQTILLGMVNCIKTICALYSAELLFIDSGGELPSYEDSCNVWQRAQRFLFPEVKNTMIQYACWLEIMFQALLMIGVCGYCLTWLLSKKKNWLVGFLLGLCGSMLAATAICGFARLRLPIEPILIMVAVIFYVQCMCRRGLDNEDSS